MDKEIKIYSSDKTRKKSILKIFKKMIVDIVNAQEVIWWLFLRDIKARYKQSLLGPAWVVVMPLITMITFLLLNMSGVIRIRDIPVPYPIYGLLGISLWQIFASGLTLATDSIIASSAIIGKTNIPKNIFVIASIFQTTIDFIIRIFILLIIYFLYLRLPSGWLILFPLYILPIFLFTLGIGFFTAVLNTIYRDTIDFVRIGLGFLIFLIPVMYTFPEKGILAVVNKYNPLFYLIQTPRDIIVSGKIVYPVQFVLSCLLSLMLFILGWLVFYKSESRIAERI